jgi:hypothetical protein
MFNYVEDKNMTTNKIKDAARLEVIEKVLELLAPFDARMVRSDGEHPANDIGLYVGEIELKDGTTVPLCATLSVSMKDPVDRRTAKKVFPAYDLAAATQRYNDYLVEKNEKEATKAELREKKIAQDNARREKKKAQTED